MAGRIDDYAPSTVTLRSIGAHREMSAAAYLAEKIRSSKIGR